jgi:hypothetical protein
MTRKTARPTGKTAKRVREREQAGKCLTCERGSAKRGLCIGCYSRFYMAVQRTTPSMRRAFERAAIVAGEVLSNRQGQRTQNQK